MKSNLTSHRLKVALPYLRFPACKCPSV